MEIIGWSSQPHRVSVLIFGFKVGVGVGLMCVCLHDGSNKLSFNPASELFLRLSGILSLLICRAGKMENICFVTKNNHNEEPRTFHEQISQRESVRF